MKKRLISILSAVMLFIGCVRLIGTVPASAEGIKFADVPSSNWAVQYIDKATELGIINGMGNNKFGLGQNVTRAQFATMLVRLMGWSLVTPSAPSFSDNADKSIWYYSSIETAVANGAVLKDNRTFRPNDYITREEMAIMLVCALGYNTLAANVADYGMPFTDITKNVGYITIAYNFGIINGMTTTKFSPYGAATREQAAAMIIRLYDKHSAKINWLHAFYAISSSSQANDIPDFDAVSFGWSRLEYTETGGVNLNTTSSGGNVYAFPSGYSTVTQVAQNSNVPANLDVVMDTSQTVTKSDGTTSNACREILLNSSKRAAAISQIIKALQNNAFLSGVTIDFEGMSGADLKAGFTAFLQELRAQTEKLQKKIYVCVFPETPDGAYYNAYDYRAIGDNCDKVILMAHDYQATSMPASLMNAGFTETPVTPLYDVYYALKAITDPTTGVRDVSKVALAISFSSAQWILQNNKVINAVPYTPDPSAIYKRLIDPKTTLNYSKQYENPYITFFNSTSNTQNVVWYEDERSVNAKIELARMFGVNSISVWRLGLIPDCTDSSGREIYYNVINTLMKQKS